VARAWSRMRVGMRRLSWPLATLSRSSRVSRHLHAEQRGLPALCRPNALREGRQAHAVGGSRTRPCAIRLANGQAGREAPPWTPSTKSWPLPNGTAGSSD
jgi:hypothetical protein